MPEAESVPVIAIDGPVGSGKGAVSHRVATALGFLLLDSGALYRVLALAARAHGVSFDDAAALAGLARDLDLEFAPGDAVEPVRILLAAVDVTGEIRTEQCGNDASRVSAISDVRDALLARQHGFRRPPGLVADGRDMGSVVFPDAPVKVFLTATARVRAERRHKQLMAKGIDVSVIRLVREMAERDKRDSERAVAPLKPAEDAVVVDTSGLDVDTVVARVLDIVRHRVVVANSGNRETGAYFVRTAPGARNDARFDNDRVAGELFTGMESFADLLEQSEVEKKMRPGVIIDGMVLAIGSEYVTVHAGLKSESTIPVDQFRNENGELEVAVGDRVEVALDTVEDGFGATKLSREKAKRAKAWSRLESAFEDEETVTGIINGKVKGGFTVDINDIRAFLPGSLVDVRPVRDTSYLEGKPLEFKVIKLDRRRNNVVVSRRAVVEKENSAEREALLESLQEGAVLPGVVKNLTDYGAFVDLGGIDGLLHITDMAWKRVKHPTEVVNVGDEIEVKVLRFDRERSRVSLGLKQLGADPWVDISRRYPESTRLFGRVTNIADYGCFVEIEEGVEGLVHVSEMDWTNKNIHPNKVVQLSDEIEVMVLDIDEDRRRISLGIKQCTPNPWEDFAAGYKKGDHVTGAIKSITDFGVFVGLDGGIDGLVHLSDLSWNEPGEDTIRRFRKGDELETVVLSVDAERERISLGVKQLDKDPFSSFLARNPKGTIVRGRVVEVDAKGALVELAEGIEGYLRTSEIARDRIDDVRMVLKVGDEVEAKFVGVDRKKRIPSLSIKAKESDEEAQALQEYTTSAPAGATTLGDLIKEQMSGSRTEGARKD